MPDGPVQTYSNYPKIYDIDHSLFVTKGRGVPVNGYVLVAGIGVIDEPTWESRLKTKCKHGYGGWKCIECNKSNDLKNKELD